MKKLISICLSAVMLLSLAACGNDISTSDSSKTTITTSVEVTEKNDNISQTTPEAEEETPTENDFELMTVRINGVDIVLGSLGYDEFLSKTGLTQVEGENIGIVTDGDSIFYVATSDGKVTLIKVQIMGSDDFFSVDTSKTEIIFPGGTSLDTLRTELSSIYPYKDNGFFSQGSMAGSEETDTWLLKLEGYNYPALMFGFENASAEKPYVISFNL